MLVQLPPSFAFDAALADDFFANLQATIPAAVALEPRHAPWFAGDADALLVRRRVARVAADPALHAGGGEPGGWRGLAYHRLHGSPHIYRSVYDAAAIARLAAALSDGDWCIFDNTMSYGAADNALDLSAASAARSGRDR